MYTDFVETLYVINFTLYSKYKSLSLSLSVYKFTRVGSIHYTYYIDIKYIVYIIPLIIIIIIIIIIIYYTINHNDDCWLVFLSEIQVRLKEERQCDRTNQRGLQEDWYLVGCKTMIFMARLTNMGISLNVNRRKEN